MLEIIIKECKCEKGRKKVYIRYDDRISSKTVKKCEWMKGCGEIFPNTGNKGEWVYSKGNKLCIFTNIKIRTGGIFFYEERKL